MGTGFRSTGPKPQDFCVSVYWRLGKRGFSKSVYVCLLACSGTLAWHTNWVLMAYLSEVMLGWLMSLWSQCLANTGDQSLCPLLD